MGRVIGLDVGSKRIGVAVSDELGVLASPHGVIRRQSYNKDAASIARVIDETEAGAVVIGLPLGLAGGFTDQTLRVQRFGQVLQTKVRIRVEWWDERLTTVMAQAVQGRESRAQWSRRQPRALPRETRDARAAGRVDELAAALILQAYLDSRRQGGVQSS